MPTDKHSVDRSHRNEEGNSPQGGETNAPDSDIGAGNADNKDNTSSRPGGTGVTSNQSADAPNRKKS